MKSAIFFTVLSLVFAQIVYGQNDANDANTPAMAQSPVVVRTILPDPNLRGSMTLEWAIGHYNTVQTFGPGVIGDAQISQITWAANMTMRSLSRIQNLPARESRQREQTRGSAREAVPVTFPFTIYLCMDTGFYRYDALTHALERLNPADIRLGLANAANKNAALRDASCDIVITVTRNSLRTKSRPVANVEAGQVAHSIGLQAFGFGLGTFPVSVFDEKFVSRQARFSVNEEPILLVAVGYPVGGIPAPVAPIQRPAAAAAPVQKQAGKIAVVVVPETFQDEELTALLDVFSVANIPLRIAGTRTGEIRGVHDSRAQATLRIPDVDPRNFDAVIFIGGPGMVDMYRDQDLQALAVRTFNSNKILAGIGEACTVFANAALIPKSRVLEQERTSNFKMKPGQTYAIPGVQYEAGIVTASGINNSTLFARTVADMLRGVMPAEGVDQQQVQRNQIFRPRKAGQTNRPAQQ